MNLSSFPISRTQLFILVVSGPYAFGVGLATFLCSKEIYIMEHEFYGGLSIGIMAVYAVKKFGPTLAAYLDKEVEVKFRNISFISFCALQLDFIFRKMMLLWKPPATRLSKALRKPFLPRKWNKIELMLSL